MHPRKGLSRVLEAFDKTVEKEQDNGHNLIGLVCDLERGTIMEVSVRKVVNKYFQDSDRIVLASCDGGGIYLYRRGKLFAIVFDPKFETVLSCLSSDFNRFYDRYKSTVKKGKFQAQLRLLILKDETIRELLSSIKRKLIGEEPSR